MRHTAAVPIRLIAAGVLAATPAMAQQPGSTTAGRTDSVITPAMPRDVNTSRDSSVRQVAPGRDTSSRDISTNRDTSVRDLSTTRDTSPARDSSARGDTAAEGDTTARGYTVAPGDTAARRDGMARPDTAARPDSAADGAARAAAPPAPRYDTSPEACDRVAKRLAANPSLRPEVPPATSMWMMPAGPPPNDLPGRGSVEASFTLLPDGSPDPATLTLRGTSDTAYKARVAQTLGRMHYRVAQLEGCAVPYPMTMTFRY
jgi:hypothetical protein